MGVCVKRLLFFLTVFITIYGSVIEVKSIDELSKQIENSHGRVYVDCYARGCYPCQLLTPLFEKWSDQEDVKDTFIKIDMNQVSNLALKYKISMVPTVLIFDKKENIPDKKTGLKEITDFFNSSHQN